MRKPLAALIAACLLTSAGCDSGTGEVAGGDDRTPREQRPRVGIILPDRTSSDRWSTTEPKNFEKAFGEAGVPVEIRNAEGDPAEFRRLGREMLETGAKVLVITNLEDEASRTVVDEAHARDVRVIDYDRLSVNAGADYYVSFDGRQVGRLQGQGLIGCLRRAEARNPVVAQLNGAPTDLNATLFKSGYDEVLQPRYDAAQSTKGPAQWVPGWSEADADRLFRQMLRQQPRIRGVLAANDGIADAVIKVLEEAGRSGRVPVTGQDATLTGLHHILAGRQCMTVYKPFGPEAQAATNLAVELFNGGRPTLTATVKDPESGARVPFLSLTPRLIDATNMREVLVEGFVTKQQLCGGEYKPLCEKNGIG
ncbi:substrate-binding domain-containing protein [Actinoplanes sp. TRM 88003]|uniref:Substrate-binding domain-containing protein n=1 Tax=Paractinoplanes aksuensis TaxID=2939490 RepID=A0ABT1DXD5_9ACTN|nr:substrate-binding domain-containing protein [Actinoplanes aksuensis]MCO8275509.1 substrate-binding domain-containing protein [Actinoplanes aksuensis]